MIALVDCNNFFVSCERLFRPALEGRPVVVLSSNDGCAVSRSNEAKALGIPMGAPLFKFRELVERHGVVCFSANFELYGDISERITNLLATVTPAIEVYSVDESFLDLSALSISDYDTWGRAVRQSILKHVGMPVSIGIAPSKTLAKLASDRAKKLPLLMGALHLSSPGPIIDAYLQQVPVADIWGVGRHLSPKLRAEGIHSALDLRRMKPRHAQQLMGIHGRHMVYELNGVSCLPLQYHSKPQQMINRGRQFGEDTRDQQVIEAAIASLTGRAAAALRRDKQLACSAVAVLRSNRMKPGYQLVTATARFNTPTADAGAIASGLRQALTASFNPRLDYHKADVILYNLIPDHSLQTDLFGGVDVRVDQLARQRLAAFDKLVGKYGSHSLHYAAEDLSQAWRPRKRLGSPRYTSSWSELPKIYPLSGS